MSKLDKWICIKEYKTPILKIGSNTPEDSFTFKVGDECIIKQYTFNKYTDKIYIGLYPTDNDSAIPMYVAKIDAYKHFITLAEWREKQINSILDD